MYKKERKFNKKIDDKNWQVLFNTHFQSMQSLGAVSTMWINGFSKLGFDNSQMPTAEAINEVSKKYTGYTFIQTDERIIIPQPEWYTMVANYQLPLSNFLRTPEELDYCDEPDIWHEIMGHVAFLMNKDYSDMYLSLAKLYIKAYTKDPKNETGILDKVDFLSGYLIELGLIQEPTGLKAFGSTLYSSGELREAFKPENQKKFSLEILDQIKGVQNYDRSAFQGTYYILESLDQMNEAIEYLSKNI